MRQGSTQMDETPRVWKQAMDLQARAVVVSGERNEEAIFNADHRR